MKNANIKAVVLDENTSRKDVFKALNPNKGAHLIFTSPEYLLRNSHMKKFCADEEARTRILGVLVDDGHTIHEWAGSLRKELKAFRVTLVNNVPWWTLSGAFTNPILKTVYETLGFGKSHHFWGIDIGTERPNLIQCVRPMGPDTRTFRPLVQFIPADAQTRDDIPKTIIFFRSIVETCDAHLAIEALLPSHLRSSVQRITEFNEETTKEKWLQDFREGHIRVLCCAAAAGTGCDIPDIAVAVIYGVDTFASFVQKGGMAGRDGKTGAKMIWLVEDWLFEGEGGVGEGQAKARRVKVDPTASDYIRCQTAGKCLREFTRQALRPEPEKLDLPGFNGRDTHGLEISWVVEGEEIQPKAGECCSSSFCRAPGSDSNGGFLTDAEKAAVEARHKLIRKVLEPETLAKEEILGLPPRKDAIQCSEEEQAILRADLEAWRDCHWKTISKDNPMLSRDWVLGTYNLKRVVDHIHLIVNMDREKIDREWLRALIVAFADDSTVDAMALAIQRFHDKFFARLEEKGRQPSGQQRVPGSQERPLSPTGLART